MQDFLFIHDNRQYLQIFFSDIIYIEALKKYIRIHTASKNYLVQTSMSHAEACLPPDQFCRIHKSYIVSIRHTKCFDNESVYIGKMTLPIGKHYKDLLQHRVNILGREAKVQIVISGKVIDGLVKNGSTLDYT